MKKLIEEEKRNNEVKVSQLRKTVENLERKIKEAEAVKVPKSPEECANYCEFDDVSWNL